MAEAGALVEVEVEVDTAAEGGNEGVRDGNGEPQAKKARIARKITASVFFEKLNDGTNNYYCKLGCIAKKGSSRRIYAVASTGTIEHHCEASHPESIALFKRVRDNQANENDLLQKVEAANAAVLAKLVKERASSDKYFARVDGGIMNRMKSEIVLRCWAAANAVPINALNCPLFDAYPQTMRAQPALNRHDMNSEVLPVLDGFVVDTMRESLSHSATVSVISDGWKDIRRRFWIDLGVVRLNDSDKSLWKIEVFDADLIPVPGSCAGDIIETLVMESIEKFVYFLRFSWSSFSYLCYRSLGIV